MPPLGPPAGLFVESKTHLGGGNSRIAITFAKKSKIVFVNQIFLVSLQLLKVYFGLVRNAD